MSSPPFLAERRGFRTVGPGDLAQMLSVWGPCGSPRAADIAPVGGPDGIVGPADLGQLLSQWGPLSHLAGRRLLVAERHVRRHAPARNASPRAGSGLGSWRATCVDTDGDRIPNAFELNDCLAQTSFPFVGTNPANSDSDNDGLSDGDEFYGTTAGLNLPASVCSPCRKESSKQDRRMPAPLRLIATSSTSIR